MSYGITHCRANRRSVNFTDGCAIIVSHSRSHDGTNELSIVCSDTMSYGIAHCRANRRSVNFTDGCAIIATHR
jgi:hypothetical protein